MSPRSPPISSQYALCTLKVRTYVYRIGDLSPTKLLAILLVGLLLCCRTRVQKTVSKNAIDASDLSNMLENIISSIR